MARTGPIEPDRPCLFTGVTRSHPQRFRRRDWKKSRHWEKGLSRQLLTQSSDAGPDRHLRPAERYFALAGTIASGILNTTIGPHDMRRRDSVRNSGRLRRAVPAPQWNAQEPASSRREGPRSRWQGGAFAPPQSNQKKSVTMSDLEEGPPRLGVKRTMAHWELT
jgi:hypothetical protein